MEIRNKIIIDVDRKKNDNDLIDFLAESLTHCNFFTVNSRLDIDYLNRKIKVYPNNSIWTFGFSNSCLADKLNYVSYIKIKITEKNERKRVVFSVNLMKLAFLLLGYFAITLATYISKPEKITEILVAFIPAFFIFYSIIRWLTIKTFKLQMSFIIRQIK